MGARHELSESGDGDDTIQELEELAQDLGRDSADTAVTSPDADREEGLDRYDTPFDRWAPMCRQILQAVMSAGPQAPIRKAGGKKELLARLFELCGEVYDRRLQELRGEKRSPKKAAPRAPRTASRRR